MHQLIVTPPNSSEEKIVGITPVPELDYWQRLENEYQKQGFTTRWINISNLDHQH